jgi:hypothetical protein
MPYLIKYRKTRLWISNIKKSGNIYTPSFNKFMSKAKYWKTEKGVKKAIQSIIKSNSDYDNYMIVYRNNSELGIWEERAPEYSEDDNKCEEKVYIEKNKENILGKLIKFINKIILYIKKEIKFYFP